MSVELHQKKTMSYKALLNIPHTVYQFSQFSHYMLNPSLWLWLLSAVRGIRMAAVSPPVCSQF